MELNFCDECLTKMNKLRGICCLCDKYEGSNSLEKDIEKIIKTYNKMFEKYIKSTYTKKDFIEYIALTISYSIKVNNDYKDIPALLDFSVICDDIEIKKYKEKLLYKTKRVFEYNLLKSTLYVEVVFGIAPDFKGNYKADDEIYMCKKCSDPYMFNIPKYDFFQERQIKIIPCTICNKDESNVKNLKLFVV